MLESVDAVTIPTMSMPAVTGNVSTSPNVPVMHSPSLKLTSEYSTSIAIPRSGRSMSSSC